MTNEGRLIYKCSSFFSIFAIRVKNKAFYRRKEKTLGFFIAKNPAFSFGIYENDKNKNRKEQLYVGKQI